MFRFLVMATGMQRLSRSYRIVQQRRKHHTFEKIRHCQTKHKRMLPFQLEHPSSKLPKKKKKKGKGWEIKNCLKMTQNAICREKKKQNQTFLPTT